MRPEWVGLRQTIKAGAEWLRDVDQPRGALVQHLGLGNHVGGTLYVSFAASGHVGDERLGGKRSGVIVFQLCHREDLPRQPSFTAEEIAEFRSLIEAAGLPVTGAWNGEGRDTGSFSVDGRVISPAAHRIFDRYSKGCPKHNTVFCGERALWGDPDRDDEYSRCTWFRGGVERMVPPAFVPVPWPTPPGPGPDDDDRNLRAVKEALEKIGPVLAEMGIHPEAVIGLVAAAAAAFEAGVLE